MNTLTLGNGPASGERRARRFVGNSVREVYALVRAQLGPDALILEQRARDGRVEVLAGLDAAEASSLVPRSQILRSLRELGLGPAALARLPAAIRGPKDVERAIADAVPCVTPLQPLCGIFRFVGPPGAGKTTALIKLAASRVLRYGRRGTLLVSTDRSRLAGSEQLASSAELLGVEYLECAEQDLPRALRDWRHMQLVLVDAPGERGDRPGQALDGVDDLLVVPAVWQAQALRALRQRFADHALTGLVLTHTDQAQTLWAGVELLVEWQLPVWWVGHGADLAVELEPAGVETVCRSILTEFDRSALTAMFQDVA